MSDLHQFLKTTEENLMVIGGRTIYQLSLPYADRLYITYILKSHEGNVYFPQFDFSQFKLVEKTMEDGLIFAVYERISL